MNFNDTPQEATFRAEARGWMDANAPKDLLPDLQKAGSGHVTLRGQDVVTAGKAWQRKKQAAGWSCLHWPKTYGGRDATPIQRVIWQQEEGAYARLSSIFFIGQGMCGPTLMAYASEEQKRQYLPPMASGQEIWCQLFSEPAAGSDVAGLHTRAVKDGSDWVIDGQKIWTSGAQYCDYGILITRTDPTVPKHAGLTMFFLSMKSPGVEIRPIRQASGESGFNEVFFNGVRIPDSQRLGAVGEGWKVSLTTLMNERMAIGGRSDTSFADLFEYVRTLETARGAAIDDPATVAKMATWAVRASGLKYTAFRSITALSKGQLPGPENSIGKLVSGAMAQDIAMFALDLQGQAGLLVNPEEAEAAAKFQSMLMRSPGARIAGGTDEILRNIIAERVLGLPGDIRPDKDVPFNQIPTKGKR